MASELQNDLFLINNSIGDLNNFVKMLEIFCKKYFDETFKQLKIKSCANGFRYFDLNTFNIWIRALVKNKPLKKQKDNKLIIDFFNGLHWNYEKILNAVPRGGKSAIILLRIVNRNNQEESCSNFILDKFQVARSIELAIHELLTRSDFLTEELGDSFRISIEIFIDTSTNFGVRAHVSPILIKKKRTLIPFLSKHKRNFIVAIEVKNIDDNLWSTILHELAHIMDPYLRNFMRAVAKKMLNSKVSESNVTEKFREELKNVKINIRDFYLASINNNSVISILEAYRHAIRIEGLAYLIQIIHNPNLVYSGMVGQVLDWNGDYSVDYAVHTDIGVLIVLQMFYLRVFEKTEVESDFNKQTMKSLLITHRNIGIGLYTDIKKLSAYSMYKEYKRLFKKNKIQSKKLAFVDENKLITVRMKEIWS